VPWTISSGVESLANPESDDLNTLFALKVIGSYRQPEDLQLFQVEDPDASAEFNVASGRAILAKNNPALIDTSCVQEKHQCSSICSSS
jgi:hypothetical protein